MYEGQQAATEDSTYRPTIEHKNQLTRRPSTSKHDQQGHGWQAAIIQSPI